MKVKCRICQFFDWVLPVAIVIGGTVFSIWYLFSGVYSQIYDNAQYWGEVLPYALLGWLCIGWLCVEMYVVIRMAFEELQSALNKWRQECQDENEETL